MQSIDKDDIDKRFRILESIGEGTYGVVYRAIDLKTDKVNKRFSTSLAIISLIFTSHRN